MAHVIKTKNIGLYNPTSLNLPDTMPAPKTYTIIAFIKIFTIFIYMYL